MISQLYLVVFLILCLGSARLSAQEPTDPAPSEQSRAMEIVVDLPQPAGSDSAPQAPQEPYVRDLLGLLSPRAHDALEQLLRSRAETGGPRVFAHTVPMRDLAEKEARLEDLLHSHDAEPVLFLVFTEQSGTTVTGLSSALEARYGQANLRQWVREAREEGRQALGNSARVIAGVESLLQSLDEADARTDPAEAEAGVEPAPPVPVPAPDPTATQAGENSVRGASSAREQSPTRRANLGDMVEEQVRQIIDDQRVDAPATGAEQPVDPQPADPAALAAAPADSSTPGDPAPADGASGPLFIFGALLGLLLIALAFSMYFMWRGRKSSPGPAKRKSADRSGKPGPSPRPRDDQGSTKPQPRPHSAIKPRAVPKSRAASKTPGEPREPDAQTAGPAPASPALPGKTPRRVEPRKFDMTDTENSVTSRPARAQDSRVMQSPTPSDPSPLTPRKKIVPATGSSADSAGAGSGTDPSAKARAGLGGDPQPKDDPAGRPMPPPRQLRGDRHERRSPAVTRENTRDQGVDPVKEFQELQALAGAQTATPPRLDAKTLEEIYQRYRKLLEVAPQTMRPDILNSLEALLREIDPDARQKRKNTASREPVALREERLRQKDAASSSAGSGNSGKTRRKDSVY